MSWAGPVGKERLGRACERRANGVRLEWERRGLCWDVTYREGRGPRRAWSACSGAGDWACLCGAGPVWGGPCSAGGAVALAETVFAPAAVAAVGAGRSAAVRGGRAGSGREPQAGARRRAPGIGAAERLRATRERGAETTEVTAGSGPGEAASASGARAGRVRPSLDSRGWRRRPRRDLGRALPAPHRAAPRSEPLSVNRAGAGAAVASTKGSWCPPGPECGLPAPGSADLLREQVRCSRSPVLPLGSANYQQRSPAGRGKPELPQWRSCTATGVRAFGLKSRVFCRWLKVPFCFRFDREAFKIWVNSVKVCLGSIPIGEGKKYKTENGFI